MHDAIGRLYIRIFFKLTYHSNPIPAGPALPNPLSPKISWKNRIAACLWCVPKSEANTAIRTSDMSFRMVPHQRAYATVWTRPLCGLFPKKIWKKKVMENIWESLIQFGQLISWGVGEIFGWSAAWITNSPPADTNSRIRARNEKTSIYRKPICKSATQQIQSIAVDN